MNQNTLVIGMIGVLIFVMTLKLLSENLTPLEIEVKLITNIVLVYILIDLCELLYYRVTKFIEIIKK